VSISRLEAGVNAEPLIESDPGDALPHVRLQPFVHQPCCDDIIQLGQDAIHRLRSNVTVIFWLELVSTISPLSVFRSDESLSSPSKRRGAP
jgi:hypothetical protein